MPMGVQIQTIQGTDVQYVPGIPSLDTRFVEIGDEIHETIILDAYAQWDQEVVENGDDAIDFWKTEENKNNLQHFFTRPHELVEGGKIAEVKYMKLQVVGARLGEADARSLIQGGVLSIKKGITGKEVFRDKVEYVTGGRQFGIHSDFVFAAQPSVFFGDMSYTDLRSLFKSLAIKGGANFYPEIEYPGGGVQLSADKTLEFRVELLELAPLVFLRGQDKARGAA